MLGLVLDFAKDEQGATAIEYGLIAGLIAVGLIAALTMFGGGVSGLFNYVDSRAGHIMNNAGS